MPAKKKLTRKTKTSDKKTIRTKTQKKVEPKKRVVKTTAIKTAMKKSELYGSLADAAELSKKEIATVFDELSQLMHRHLRKGGVGEFALPGLMKLVVKRKPATKKRDGINPFTGEPTVFKAKPARNIVKIRPLKRTKEMVE